MKTHQHLLRKVPQAALSAILSLSLILRPAYAVDPGVVSTSGGSSLSVVDGSNSTGYFLQSGTYNISNVTLQNFSTTGGSGSGGGAGLGGVLFINTGASVTLNNVNFLSNNVTGGKGGVGTAGGSLNNLFNSGGTTVANGVSGSTPDQNIFTDIGGTTGTKGTNGANNLLGFGGVGGNGGNGGNGGDSSPSLILGTVTAAIDVANLLTEEVAAGANPFTANIAGGLVGTVASSIINLANAVAAVVSFDQSLSDGQIGLGGGAGKGGNGGSGGFGYGGVSGGNGGNGGVGGANWSGSAFSGGAAGGDAGDGGNGGMGGFGAGGGSGGNGGVGGLGAHLGAITTSSPAVAGTPAVHTTTPYIPAIPARAAGFDENGLPSNDPKYALAQAFVPEVPGTVTYVPAVPAQPAVVARAESYRASGLDGAAGSGGSGGFGAGAGTSGTAVGELVAGGSGGSGYGGAIFVRAGATLTITGNALFDGNGSHGGSGQAANATTVAGAAGAAAGSDLFIMKGATVNLDPGAGNVITFNGDASGTSIADDSFPSGVSTPTATGQGADIHIKSGLVVFNGTNLYSGQTILDGGVLQALDGTGIYFDSNINFKGGVLQSNGDFTRYVGTLSNRVQWTGDGGFAANDGELNVRLSNNQTMLWGSNSFVPSGNALLFGSESATNKVNFQNNINLNGGNRTILVTANDADLENNVDENIDWAVLNGVISNGSLTLGDATHKGVVVMTKANTYTGSTTVNGGGLALADSGSIADTAAVNLAADTSFDISAITAGSETIGSLTAASGTKVVLGGKNLKVGDGNDTTVAGVISGDGGSVTKQGTGKLTLTGANTYTGATTITDGTVALSGDGSLEDTSPVNITGATGTFDISAINADSETIGSISGVAGSKAVLGAKNLTAGGAADTTMAGVISGNGGSLTKTGTGKLTLTAANTYTSDTTIAKGTVALVDAGSLADSTAVKMTDATSVLDISAKTDSSETVASLSSVAGSSVVLGAKNITAGDSTDTTVAGTISGTGGSYTKTGSGKTTFTGADTYTGATTIDGGVLALSAGGSLSDLSAVNITSATGVLDISAITATSETIASIAGVAGSQVFLGAKNLTAGSAADTVMAGVISDGGIAGGTGGSLTKQGAGKLTLSGANTYTGDTTVNVGTVETSGDERIANASDLIVASGAIFRLGGMESLSSIAGAGNIELQANTLVSNANVNTTFSGVMSGTNASVFTKTGTGKLTLSGANTYTGSSFFNEGSVDLTGSLESKTVVVATGVVLDSKAGGLSSLASVTNNGTINLGSTNDTVSSYTSTGTLNGPGTLTASAYNLNGGSVVNANLGAGTITTNGTVDLYGTSAAATIVINAASVLNLKAPELILNTASVTVNGTLNLDYTPAGTETFQRLLGSGTINTMGNALIVADGGSFTGTLNASGATLTTGGGAGGGGGGGGLTLGGGTTTTQSTNIDSGLTIGAGATLDSGTIIIANGSILDLSGGGTIKFTTLTSKDNTPAIINIGANDFTIPAGSTISGWVTFIGTGRVINNGTISPGFSPAVLVIPAATVDTPISITKLELAGLGGVAGADFDQVRLTTTLAADGTLNVAHFGGFTSAQGNSFQAFSNAVGGALAAGAITGNFATVTFDNDGFAPPGGPNPAVTPTAAFVLDLDTGVLTSTGLNAPTNTYADLGSNANQRGAAASIFAAATAGVGPSQIRTSTTAGFLAQQITDATGSSAADLARYTPDYYGSLADYAFMGNQVLVRSIQDRVSPMNYIPSQIGEDSLNDVPETMSVFVGYTYANMNTADSATATRNDYYAGVNLLASEDYVVGIAGSMSQGSIHASLGSASSDGWGGMAFGRFTVAKSFTFFGSFGFNQQNMDLRRQTVNGSVSGSTDVASYVGFLGVQYKGWRVGGVSIAPRLSLSYSNSQVKGFNESGAIDALNVGGYHNNRFMGEAGLSALWSTDIAGHALNLELAASVQQYFQNTKSQALVNVATVPAASYGVNFAKNGSTQGVIQFNAGYELFKAVTTYVGYEGHFGNQSTQYAKAGLRVNF